MQNQIMVWLSGNLTAQAASNFNLSEFDSYVINELGLKEYVRYVDDIVILADNKKILFESLPFIIQKFITNLLTVYRHKIS